MGDLKRKGEREPEQEGLRRRELSKDVLSGGDGEYGGT